MDWASATKPIWAAVIVGTIFMVFVRALFQSPAPTAVVVLESLRGEVNGPKTAIVLSGAVFDLTLNTTEARGFTPGKITIVDEMGNTMWSEEARIVGGVITRRVDVPLKAGTYWVRLAKSGYPKTLVGEYQLTVE